MKYLVEIIALLLLLFCFYSLLKKNNSNILFVIIGYYVFADYVFFFSGYEIGELSFGKLFIDILFIFILSTLFLYFLSTVIKYRSCNKRFLLYFLFFIASLFLLLLGALDNEISSAIIGWRAIFLPIFLAEGFLLLTTEKNQVDIDWNKLVVYIVVFAAINSIIAITQYFTYNGDFKSVWRYQLLLDAKSLRNYDFLDHFMGYQIERGGQLRASGLMVSALSYSYFCVLGAIFSLFCALEHKSMFYKFLYFILFLVLILGVYVSQVRTSLFVLLLFPMLYFAISFFRLKSNMIVLLTIFIVAFTGFIGVVLETFLDSSGKGRIDQYMILVSQIEFLGAGLGSHLGEFDSYYVHTFMVLGVFGFLPLIYFTIRLKKIAFDSYIDRYNRLSRTFLVLSILLFLVFFVQHVASSLYYFVSLMILFGTTSNFKEVNKVTR